MKVLTNAARQARIFILRSMGIIYEKKKVNAVLSKSRNKK